MADRVALEQAVARAERRSGRPLPPVLLDRTDGAAAALPPLGALAAAQGRRVVLPLAVGPLNGPRAAGLLAHELTHVAQQAHGDATNGDAEHEARRAEAAAGGRALRTLPPQPEAEQASPSPVRALPAVPHEMRAGTHVLASRPARPTHLRADGGHRGRARSERPAAVPPEHALPPRPAAVPTGRTAAAPAAAPVQLAEPDHDVEPRQTRPRDDAAQQATPELTPLSSHDLDLLAARLYPRIRSSLRGELLADRDRVSDLFDPWS